MTRSLVLITVIPTLMFLCSCSESTSPPPEVVTLDDLLSAPLELTIGGSHLLLNSHLNLSSMPSIPPFRGFVGEVWVWEREQQQLPDDLHIEQVWVILGDEISTCQMSGVLPGELYELRRWIEADRRWGQVTVQVVARLAQAGVEHLLRAEEQHIKTTI